MAQSNFIEDQSVKPKRRQDKTRRTPKTKEVYIKHKDYLQLQLQKNQKEVINFIKSNQISIITADPGCGKTTIALYYALEGLSNGQFECIVITKPNVECGKSIGFLPGEIGEKLDPYKASFKENVTKIVGKMECEKLFKSCKIKFEAIPFIRGKTLEHSCIIYDEFQNSEISEIMSVVTRKHYTSKLIMLGDFYQKDIRNSGFHDFLHICKDVKNIDHIELDDSYQMRDEIIVDLYKNYKKHILFKKQ